jgi:replication factor C subunit 1
LIRRPSPPLHDCKLLLSRVYAIALLTPPSYNQQSHPLPFMKASSVAQPKKQAKEKPDLEEAIDESDDGEVVEEVKEEDEDVDLSKDKYVKQPKKKAAPKKGAAAAKKGGKKKKDEEDEDEDEEDEVKPKGKGKANAAPKGKKK